MDQPDTDKLGNVISSSKSEKHEAPSVAVGLNDMPLEILLNIFSYLDPMQLTSIRLVCKQWQYAISRPETWSRLFHRKFGISSDSFPSLSNTNHWMVEYFDRARVLKRWRKAVGVHKSFELINNEQRMVDCSLADFHGNEDLGKLLTFSQSTGNIAICNLKNGKNQKFIPGGSLSFKQISCFSINWNYLLVGKTNGELCVKRLQSTTGVSGKSSITPFIGEDTTGFNSPILATDMNTPQGMDKYRERVDILSGSLSGEMKFWNLNGSLVHTEKFSHPIINIKSDFKKYIIVNTLHFLYIVDYSSFKTLAKVSLGFVVDTEDFNTNTTSPWYHFQEMPSLGMRNTLDVDFGDANAIFTYESTIQVVNFSDVNNLRTKSLHLPNGVRVVKSQFQTCSPNKIGIYNSRNVSIVGKDALLFANVLSNGSVMVWNVRDHSGLDIVPQIVVDPETVSCPGHSFDIFTSLVSVSNIALNSSVLAIGGYNGFVNLYNVNTGKYFRQASLRFAKQIRNLRNDNIPISNISLNDDQKETNGVIVCGDTIQYFQFGDTDIANNKDFSKNRKKLNHLPKNDTKQSIKNEMMHYDSIQDEKQKEIKLVDRYNGRDNVDADDELSLALAISQSYQNPKTPSEDEDLRLALELSKQTADTSNYEESTSVPPTFHYDASPEPYESSSHPDPWLSSASLSLSGSISTKTTPSTFNTDYNGGDSDLSEEEKQLQRILELSLLEQ